MLRIENVKKCYSTAHGELAAVNDVSIQVTAGELAVIRGSSGCGKTTLLLMAGALLHPTSGTVRIDGQDPYALSPNDRSRFRADHIGFVFQQFHLVPYLNVQQNVLTANVPTRRPDADNRARELIGQFGLQERVTHVPAELSVGEKQRVALARALFNQPQLLLADEPTGNLDPDNASIVLDALNHFAQQGGAVLMVTHDPTAAARAGRQIMLEAGRVLDASEASPGAPAP